MILDLIQAKRVHDLTAPCAAYCAELAAVPLSANTEKPLLIISAWLETNAGRYPGCAAAWSSLCGLMAQSETNRNRSLAELLALGLVMDARMAQKQETLSGPALKKAAARLAHIHSQFCVLQHAEMLWAKAADHDHQREVLTDLQKLLQKNAHTRGVLKTDETAKNLFNGVCSGCRKKFQKGLLNLRENEMSYARILLDTYTEVLRQENVGTLTKQWPEYALKDTEGFPAAFFQDIPQENQKNTYAAAAVFWQMLENSPEPLNFLRDYQLARYDILDSHASVSKGMARFGRAPLALPECTEAQSENFFRYAVYDGSSPALFVVQKEPAWEEREKLDAAFMTRPDSGALFALCAELFFALYKGFSAKKGPALPERKEAAFAVWNAFETLRTQFPAQAEKSRLEGASFADFVYFLEKYADKASCRKKLMELLTVPNGSNCQLNFTKMNQLLPGDDAPEGTSVWQDFCAYWKLGLIEKPGFGRQKKGDNKAQWKKFVELYVDGNTKNSGREQKSKC